MDHFAGLDVSVKKTSVCIRASVSGDLELRSPRVRYELKTLRRCNSHGSSVSSSRRCGIVESELA
jgi:hypothetical protein